MSRPSQRSETSLPMVATVPEHVLMDERSVAKVAYKTKRTIRRGNCTQRLQIQAIRRCQNITSFCSNSDLGLVTLHKQNRARCKPLRTP